MIVASDEGVTWTKTRYCHRLFLIRQIKPIKKHERTLNVIDNSVNSTVMGILKPFVKDKLKLFYS